MRGYVANTDEDWLEFLRSQPPLDEVNFWQPSGGRGFHAIRPGSPFFFKLKSPHNAVAGFGIFVRQAQLPAWLAWETFGPRNGAPDFETMRRRIEKYRRSVQGVGGPAGSYVVGCLLVSEPFFFPREAWIPQPSDYRRQIVQGKTYDLLTGEGRMLWDACLERARSVSLGDALPDLVAESARYGSPRTVRPRLGQGTFRVAVTDAYGRACAVTSEHSLPALDAAHIVPYAAGGAHEVSNGILLRRDIHRLFDLGYVTVDSTTRCFEVSRRLREEWDNGRIYYEMRGRQLREPAALDDRPSKAFLDWHNSEVFLQ
jgi:putative restriction endonuclease